MQRTTRSAATMLFVTVAPLAAPRAGAQPTSSVRGTVLGAPLGAAVTWPVTMPPSANVTLILAHWPCQAGGAPTLDVHGPAGLIAKSHEPDACAQKAMFNTVAGGSRSVKLLNYLAGVEVTYTLAADGLDLAAPEAGAVEPQASGVDTDQLLDNTGGAFHTCALAAEAGHTYVLDLSYGMAGGGSPWTGVSIDVWAPNTARLARSTETSPSSHRVSFTPTANMTLSVQVFNDNPGQTMTYALLGLPGGQED